MAKTQRYVLGKGNMKDLKHEASIVWAEVIKPGSELHQLARNKHIDIDSFKGDYTRYFRIKKAEAPIVPGAFEILIAVLGSAVAKKVGADLWNVIFIPWLKNKLDLNPVSKGSKAKKKAPGKGEKKG